MKKRRVTMPSTDSAELFVLARKILAKHLLDGSKSVLDHMDWVAYQTAMETAEQYEREAEDLRIQSAKRIIDRDIAREEVITNIRSVRDILTGLNIRKMKNLGDWGFEVIESVSVAAKAKTKSKKQEQTPALNTKS